MRRRSGAVGGRRRGVRAIAALRPGSAKFWTQGPACSRSPLRGPERGLRAQSCPLGGKMKEFLALTVVLSVIFHSGTAYSEPERTVADVGVKMASAEAETKRPGGGLRALLSRLIGRKAEPAVRFTREWIDARPRAEGGPEWECLTQALYFEARGESVKGQFAVAEVIRNRVKSSRFPDTYCGVIRQGTGRKYQCQFTFLCDGRKEVITEPAAWERVGKVARAVLDGVELDLTGGATYYHTTAVRPRWARKFTKTAQIGVHVFYRPKLRTASNG